MGLHEIWFVLLGVLLAGYAILDGFDLGIGVVFLAARKDEHRRTLMNSIGPVWDGNLVWLITFGGALFAAFPHVYATVFSGFYLALMLVLVALILRAVALEFRSKEEGARWRQFWDVGFCVGSTLAALLFGVAVGNIMVGVKVGADMEYAGSFIDLLGPYPVLIGLLSVTMMATQGALYGVMKTEGALAEVLKAVFWRSFGAFLILLVVTTVTTILAVPAALANFASVPVAWLVVILGVAGLGWAAIGTWLGKPLGALLAFSCCIACMVFLLGMRLFPTLVPSSLSPDWDLTIYNAASTPKTLSIMLTIVIVGMPLVLVYSFFIYRVFRGKARVGRYGY